jgi:T5SS/PEP-CTERM-associated repeat protein
MKTKYLLIAAAVIGLAALRVDAETGITNTINGYTYTAPSDYYVGQSGTFNALIVTNGGQLNDHNGYISYLAGAANNTALVTGSGSIWSNTTSLVVGNSGGGNQLTIQNGGTVRNVTGSVGGNGGNNTVLISGASALWSSTGNLILGGSGGGNSLTLTNGGVLSAGGYSDVGNLGTAGNNTAVITGPNSQWNAGSAFTFGDSAGGNSLTIASGGVLAVAGSSVVGNNSGVNNNTILVTGGDSVWTNSGTISLGNDSTGNSLTITNSGAVSATGLTVGYFGSGTNNQLNLANGNLNVAGTLAVPGGTVSFNGGNVTATTLISTNNSASATNALFNFNYGTLTTYGGQMTPPSGGPVAIGNTAGQTATWNILGGTNTVNGNIALGNVAGATANVLVTGTNTVWNNGSIMLNVGYAANANNNQLTIQNGAQVVNGGGDIGFGTGASSNAVLVTGPGSVWNNSGTLNVGYGTNANNSQLTIQNGAQVSDSKGDIGYDGANNSVLVTGSGSVWNNVNSSGSAILVVGDHTAGNQLTVANGGYLYNNIGSYIGYNAAASNNSVLVTGSGSVWKADQLAAKYVGYNGSGNSLIVSNGGFFQVGSQGGENGIFIGNGSTANNNSVTINGAGMLAYTKIYVGYNGSGNSLTIANGGVLTNRSDTSQESVKLWVGYNANSSNNSVTVTGPGSLYYSSFSAGYNQIYLGYSGSSNSLTVSAGGEVLLAGTNNDLFSVGYKPGANNNALTITGNNSLLSIQGGDLILGGGPDDGGGPYNAGGSGNQMTIAAGGTVSNINGYIGYNTNAANNAATVSGAGSSWNNSNNLYIGYGPGANNSQLTIANGGQVQNIQGDIGYGGSNNIVLVTGTNAVWQNTGNLFVGDNFAGNQLTITSGGRVNDTTGYVGNQGGSTSNTVLVTGSGSVWNSSGDLNLGERSPGNSLTIASSGVVASANGWIGVNSGADNNSMLVTGSGSVWTNSGTVYVGYAGNYCSLLVTNGAGVSAGNLLAGGAGANNNSFAATGSGSVVNVASTFATSGDYATVTLATGVRIFSGTVNIQGGNNTILLTGSGSVWTNSGTFGFGYSGAHQNQLTLSGGAALYDNYGQIARKSQGNNTMLVTDSGTIWSNATGMELGYQGSGDSLTISNGAAATFGGSIAIAGSTGRNVQMILSGGNINDAGGLSVSNSASTHGNAFVFNYGTLTTGSNGVITVSPGSDFTLGNTAGQTANWNIVGGTNSIVPVPGNAANTILGNSNGAVGNVLVSGAGTVWTNGGALQIINGTLTIAQGQTTATQYTQNAGGTLAFQLGGTPSNGVLSVSGTAQLGGTLNVTNLNGFNPVTGNAFTLVTAQTVTGTFAATNLPALGGGNGWQLTYAPTSVSLSVVAVAAPLSALKFTASPVISGTSLTISATNTGAGAIYLLTSTNMAAPLNTWTPIWTNVSSGSGGFTTNLSNAVNPAQNQQFYLLGNTNN